MRFANVFKDLDLHKDLCLYTEDSVKLNLIEDVKPIFCKSSPMPLAR